MKSTLKNWLPALLPIVALIPWAMMQMRVALNTNHAWLSIAAGRLLDGGRMTQDFYDPDPPLSILVYLPPVLLSRLTGWPIYDTPYLCGFVYLSLSLLVVVLLLRRMPSVDQGQLWVVVAAYLMASTYLTTNFYFAERDEMVAWGLFPFLLAQLQITSKNKSGPGLLWPVLVLGAVAILIKPQYGLFPVLMLIHRAILRHRFFSLVKDADFLALAGAVIGYFLVMAVYFSDYLTQILPQFPVYYSYANPHILPFALECALPLLACLACAYLLELKKSDRDPAVIALLAACLALGLFYVQRKGFYYHMIPTYLFAATGGALFFLGLLKRWMREEAATCLTVLLVVGGLAIASPPQWKAVTHEEYKQTPLAGLVAGCAPNCSYFIYGESMETILQVSIYTGAQWASRYPAPWWLETLAASVRQNGPEKDHARIQLARHTAMTIADFERYKPQVLAIIQYDSEARKNPDRIDFISFFSQDPAFRTVMLHYRKTGELHDNRQNYFHGTPFDFPHPVDYDIYRRID